jgi:hypothetical protein
MRSVGSRLGTVLPDCVVLDGDILSCTPLKELETTEGDARPFRTRSRSKQPSSSSRIGYGQRLEPSALRRCGSAAPTKPTVQGARQDHLDVLHVREPQKSATLCVRVASAQEKYRSVGGNTLV